MEILEKMEYQIESVVNFDLSHVCSHLLKFASKKRYVFLKQQSAGPSSLNMLQYKKVSTHKNTLFLYPESSYLRRIGNRFFRMSFNRRQEYEKSERVCAKIQRMLTQAKRVMQSRTSIRI